MADGNSRFQSQSSQGQTTQERLSTHTVGLVALSDYRKRRADVLEQQEREAREAALSASSRGGTTSGAATPDPNASDSGSGNKQPAKKKVKGKKKQGKSLLSFDDEEGDDGELEIVKGKVGDKNKNKDKEEEEETADGDGKKSKFAPNAGVTVVPKAMTKSALRKEAAERETLRKEFLIQREAVKAAEIAIPFVFYDGSNIPGGMVRVKKGDFVWLFLDKSRKVGAERGVGEKSNARRAWARVGVDDLMMIRGTIIIPHVSLWSILPLFASQQREVSNEVTSTTTSTTSSPTNVSAPTDSESSTIPPKHLHSRNYPPRPPHPSRSRLPNPRPQRRWLFQT